VRWPEQKFRAFYAAYVKRKVEEDIDRRRVLAISALQGNSAFMESNEGPELLKQRIRAIEDAANDAIRTLYSGPIQEDDSDPYGFFEAGRRGMRKNGLID
jgi:hypothetical protein